MTKTNKVFLDSSVLIAAAISRRGAARDLLRRGFRGDLELSVSPLVLEEVERNLARKAPEALPDFRSLRDLLAVQLIEPPKPLVLAVARVVVLKDAPIVAAAVAATYLATYDRRHLLRQKDEIKAQFALLVATPDEVLAAQH